MDILKLKIRGMHCTSCAFDIDGELEDTQGVRESSTNYAKSEAKVVFDPKEISQERIIQIINKVGYQASVV